MRTVRRLAAAAALLLAGLAAPGPVATAAAPAAADPPPWTTLAKTTLGGLPDVSCGATTWCWAVTGGGLLSSTDAGRTWATRSADLPAEVDALDAVDCPSAELCFASARLADQTTGVVAITPGGMSLTPTPVPTSIDDLACPTVRRCLGLVADGASVLVTTDGGATWAVRPRSLPFRVHALSCVAGTSTCTGVGSRTTGPAAVRTTNLGGGWTAQSLPDGISALVAIDCPSELACHAVGREHFDVAIVRTRDGGATWTRRPAPDVGGALDSVSCASEDVCVAVGAGSRPPFALGTTDRGATWGLRAQPPGPGDLPAVACPTLTQCAVVVRGGLTSWTGDAGTAWQVTRTPTALGAFGELSCPEAGWCVATAHDELYEDWALTSPDGGRTWTRRALPPGTEYITSLDRPTRLACYAWALDTFNTRSTGQALRSSDGGLTWRLRRSAPVSTLAVADVGCADALTCLAVGTARRGAAVRRTTDGGVTWEVVAPPAEATALSKVGCTAETCVLLGRSGSGAEAVPATWHSTDAGSSYARTPLADPTASYQDLDCTGPVCVLVGGTATGRGLLLRSRDGGETWGRRPIAGGAGRLGSVSCTPGACAAIGGDRRGGGLVVAGYGSLTDFAVAATPPMNAYWAPSAVACGSPEVCLAADLGPVGYPRVIGTTPPG